MIAENVTVTTTPTTILDLVLTARGLSSLSKSDKVKDILFRVATDATAIVYAEETDTASAVVLLDPANIVTPQTFASFSEIDLRQCLLSCDSGSVSIGIIASQEGHSV